MLRYFHDPNESFRWSDQWPQTNILLHLQQLSVFYECVQFAKESMLTFIFENR